MILASAFRIDGIAIEDAGEIMRFKDIVRSYLKMEAYLQNTETANVASCVSLCISI